MDNEFLWDFLEEVNSLYFGYAKIHNNYPNVCLVDKHTYRKLAVDKEITKVFDMNIVVVDTLQRFVKLGVLYG